LNSFCVGNRLQIICVFATVFADNSSCGKKVWKEPNQGGFSLDLAQFPPLPDPKRTNFLESSSNIHEIKSKRVANNGARIEKSNDFIGQLNSWFPNLQEFNQKFVLFLKQKGLNDEDFKRVLNKEHFITSTRRYLKEFSSINQHDYLRGLHKQIEDILVNYYAFDSTSLEGSINFIDAANFTVSTDYFYDEYVIKSKLDPIVSQLKRQESFAKLNDTLAVWYPTSINLNSIVVEYFMMENIQLEIIGEISENHTKFNEYLLSHAYEISRLHKSEVQDGIYDQIKRMLRDDYREFDEIHGEIIDDLKRSRKMASSYWVNLIYDNELLRKIVKSPLNAILEARAYENLEKSLVNWYSEIEQRNSKALSFLRAKKYDAKFVQALSKDKAKFESFRELVL
jgi:hypothetical protein